MSTGRCLRGAWRGGGIGSRGPGESQLETDRRLINRKVHHLKQQIEAELKQDMLDRGLSSEEIEQVIEARPREGIDRWINSWGKKQKT